MYHKLWRTFVGLSVVCALFVSGTNIAMADDNSKTISNNNETAIYDITKPNTDLLLNESDYANPTARTLIENEIGVSGLSVESTLSDKVSLSLNLTNSAQLLPDKSTFGLSEEDIKILNSLPSVDAETGEVSIPNPETREMFSMRPKDHAVSEIVDGVSLTQDKDAENQVTAISHVTADESGQIIGVIKDDDVSFMDFSYTLPNGYRLKARSDGGFDLLSQTGEIEGGIDAPWAIDASGKPLSTSYELVGGNVLRQQVKTEDASYPITLDPSWSWWLITAGKCALSIAPLLVTGGAAIAARAPKLISFINKLSKTPKIAAAVRKVGGVKNAASATVKNAVIILRSKLPKWVKFPSPKLTAEEKVLVTTLWPFLVDNFWDLIGIGSCYSLSKGK